MTGFRSNPDRTHLIQVLEKTFIVRMPNTVYMMEQKLITKMDKSILAHYSSFV